MSLKGVSIRGGSDFSLRNTDFFAKLSAWGRRSLGRDLCVWQAKVSGQFVQRSARPMIGHHPWRAITLLMVLVSAGLACSLGNPAEVTTENLLEVPLVVILAPLNGSVIAEGVDVPLYAIAQDSGPGVTRLEFRVDDIPVGEVLAEQLDGQSSLMGRVNWPAAGNTGHLVTVEAFRADGSSLGISDVTVRVIEKPVAQLPAGGQPSGAPGGADATQIPTLTPAPTRPVLPGVAARVTSADLNVRQGPGTTYPVVGTLQQGEVVEIVGRNAASDWWAITYRTGTAWVFASLLQPDGDVSQVPLVAAP